MKQTELLRSLEERPLRMAVEPELAREKIVVRQVSAPVPVSDSAVPAIVIVALAFWLVYAFMRTIPA